MYGYINDNSNIKKLNILIFKELKKNAHSFCGMKNMKESL